MDNAVDEVLVGDASVGESMWFRSPELADLLEAEIAAARARFSVADAGGGSADDGSVPGGAGPSEPVATVEFIPVP